MNRVLASFTRSEKNIIAFVLALIASGYGILEYQERQKGTTVFSAAPDTAAPTASLPPGLASSGRISINAAGQEVLETLPGVGPSLAAAILRHRTAHGPFAGLNDLDSVAGVGPAMLEKLAAVVEFDTSGTVAAIAPATAALPAAPTPSFSSMAAAAPVAFVAQPVIAESGPTVAGLVNVNIATPEQLDTLDGVGPALARRIIEDRTRNGPFYTVESLLRVKGIGPAILRKNKGRIALQ